MSLRRWDSGCWNVVSSVLRVTEVGFFNGLRAAQLGRASAPWDNWVHLGFFKQWGFMGLLFADSRYLCLPGSQTGREKPACAWSQESCGCRGPVHFSIISVGCSGFCELGRSPLPACLH